MKKICIKCNKEFEAKDGRMRVCQSCKNLKKVCPVCGKEFIPERIGYKTCSNKCRYELMKSKITKHPETQVCEFCGKEFKWKKSKTCSKECQKELVQKNIKETLRNKYNKDITNVFQLDEVKSKIKDYWNKNYNVDNPTQVEEIKEKQKNTFIKNHGYYSPASCHKHGNTRIENSMFNLIKELLPNVAIIKNTKQIIKNPETNCYLELDIYIPDLNIAIEYNGSYWHNRNDTERENLKTKLCKEKGIKLFHIWYDNEEQDIKELLDYIKEVKNEI